MLARTNANLTPNDFSPDKPTNGRVTVEVSDVAMADRIVDLLSTYQDVEVVIDGSQSNRIVRLPGHSASSATAGAVRRVLVTDRTSEPSVLDGILKGVWAYVDAAGDDLDARVIETVQRVAKGQCPVLERVATDPETAIELMGVLATRSQLSHVVRSNPLTKTEIEILSRIARGQTSKEIAKDLVFKVQTVKNRVTAIMNKTNANSRGHAAAIAQANGWIDAHPNRL